MTNKKQKWKCALLVSAMLAFITPIMVHISCIYDPHPVDQTVQLTVSSAVHGLVIVNRKDTIRVSTVYTKTQIKGTVDTLIVVADSGFTFAGWNMTSEKFQNPLRITLTDNMNIAASFVKKPDNLIFVQSQGKTFSMGTDGKIGASNERPAHQVYFDYNYYLSSKEITIKEFNALMPSSRIAQSPDSLPVNSVTWYDAILYCNELSVRAGYDTVYTYKSKCTGNDECPFVLEGWKIHYDRAGYRLPTEAEWEYACRASTTTDTWWGNSSPDSFAWYVFNSSNTLHVPGTLKPNPWGFYDMTGNVAEWVNDWLSDYDNAIDTNPVGSVDVLSEIAEQSWQRPVRGGSYRLGTNFLRSSVRAGPYETSAFISQKDIGFRVAFGAFTAGNTKSSSTDTSKPNDTIPADVVANKTDLLQFIGTSSAKCVFVCASGLNRRLYCVDYTSAGTPIFPCGKDTSVNCPVISPDGQYVAFSSGGEGFGGVCSLTVKKLIRDTSLSYEMKIPGTIPRWWVSPNGTDTFLIYVTGASMNNQPKWHTEKTMKLRMHAGKAAGQPEVFWPTGSYHGGLSSDGRFLATGYPVTRLVDLQITDTNVYYFWPPFSGRDDTAQTCNVSSSPSLTEPGEVMLLDFGYPRVSTVVGSSYGFHEVIFVCNTMMNEKHVSNWYRVPKPFDHWDYPEYSNHPGFAAALACAYDSNAIEIINCEKRTYQPLLSGKQLRDMYLWIDPAKLPIVNDPFKYFGRYDLPTQAEGQLMLSKKLHTFWKYRDEWEFAMLGSSTAYYGFAPSVMSRKAINLGCKASDIFCAEAVAEYYCLPHAPKLKALVVDLMSYSFDMNSYKVNPRLTGLLDSKGFEIDSANHFYRDGLPSQIVSKINTWGPADWSGLDSLGFHTEVHETGWDSIFIDKGDYSIDDTVVQAGIAMVKRMAKLASEKQIHVLIVNTPQSPDYATSTNMGRLGPSVTTFKKLVDILIAYEKENPYFHYYDANNFGNHDYTSEDAYDVNHLSPKGAAKLTSRIDSIVNTFKLKD